METLQPDINHKRIHRHKLAERIRLTDRERTILRSIIHYYILTAEPVGSRSLARRFRIGLSPATIRNSMADLEDMGLLTHPHISAGRIPTDLGYRIYVDDLMHVEELSDEVRQSIHAHLESISPEIDQIMDNVSELLSDASRMLAIILAPDLSTGVLDKVELIRVAAGRIMVVVVISSGLVRTILLELNSEITDDEIVDASNLINQRLAGMRLSDIPGEISSRLTDEQCKRNTVVRMFLDFPGKIFAPEPVKEMHIGSPRQLLEHPEYSTPDKLRGIIELIEDRDIIVHLLKDRSEGVSVTIGEENIRERFKNLSVITSTYRTGNELGTLGIIGPTRMNYSRLVSLVDYTARLVSRRVARNVRD